MKSWHAWRNWSKLFANGTTGCLPNKSERPKSASSVPRPEYVARLHGAKYDLRFCDRSEKTEMLQHYREALAAAAKEAGVSATLLEAAVAKDFWHWVKEERLPVPPKGS